MNILVIFTGGTIGSTVTDGYIGPASECTYKLIEQYKQLSSKHNREAADFDIIQPYSILSENLSAFYINTLINSTDKYISNAKYDGIIITHGTDTLQYTSAALGYAFTSSPIPIVLVSSNYILEDERANGSINFYTAVEFIRYCTENKQNTYGVYTAYRNTGDIPSIHYSTRLLPHMPYSDDVYSVDSKPYGSFDMDKITIYHNQSTPTKSFDYKTILLDNLSSVMYIRPVPGQIYPIINDTVKAILFDTFHSGTLCTDDEAFKAFIEKAAVHNIPVFLTGAENRTGYASTKIYKELMLNVLPKASPIAMYIKLWFLTSAGLDSATIIDLMYKNTGYEFIA